MPKCAFCQTNVETAKPGRRDECPGCGRDLHGCYQCRFYDGSTHNECREPQADFVAEKDKANFCDYFVFDPHIRVKIDNQTQARERWEGLFRKK